MSGIIGSMSEDTVRASALEQEVLSTNLYWVDSKRIVRETTLDFSNGRSTYESLAPEVVPFLVSPERKLYGFTALFNPQQPLRKVLLAKRPIAQKFEDKLRSLAIEDTVEEVKSYKTISEGAAEGYIALLEKRNNQLKEDVADAKSQIGKLSYANMELNEQLSKYENQTSPFARFQLTPENSALETVFSLLQLDQSQRYIVRIVNANEHSSISSVNLYVNRSAIQGAEIIGAAGYVRGTEAKPKLADALLELSDGVIDVIEVGSQHITPASFFNFPETLASFGLNYCRHKDESGRYARIKE